MLLKCVKEFLYQDADVTFPFHAGTEYSVPDEMGQKVIETSPESFEVIKEKPKGKGK